MKKTISFLVGSVFLIGLTALGCGEESLKTSYHPIINGTPVEDEQSGHVLIYYHNLGRSRCSGTLLTPNWVLTAAHCFYLRETGNHDWLLLKTTVIDPNSVEVKMGNQSILASEIVLHPIGFPHVDLALIRLESPFEMPSEEYEPHFINPIYAGTKESVVGTVVSCHGYGCYTTDDDEGNCEGFGYLRQAWLDVVELLPSSDVLPYGQYHLLQNERGQLQWRGDSGSSCSLVLHLEDQTELHFLIGVTSMVGHNMSGLVPITDPDAREWILRTIFSDSFDTYVWPKPLPRNYHKEVDWRPCDGDCYNWTSEYILTDGGKARFVSHDPYYSRYVWGPDPSEIHPGYNTYTGTHPTCCYVACPMS